MEKEMNILLIDDEETWCRSLKRTLQSYNIANYENIFTSLNSLEAVEILEHENIDIVLLDLMLGSELGSDILQIIKDKYPKVTVVIMTGVNSIQQAASCINQGASDYLIKNMPVDELVSAIRRIIKIYLLEKENETLKSNCYHQKREGVFKDFITINDDMVSVIQYIKSISESVEPLLITGESGVGKGILAKAAADISRHNKPFLPINVAGLDAQMFSDTLFGHIKGAFTGAEVARQGLIQQAGDGTVFLDEIGDLPLQSQIKLLYVLQDKKYRPLGSDKEVYTNARFICATNQDLEAKIKAGEFRKDLFFRLNTHKVHLTPLRERREDIPILIRHFIDEASKEYKKEVVVLPDYILSLLQTYDFPGNVRQIRSIVYDIVARNSGETLHLSDFKNLFTSVSSEKNNGKTESTVMFCYDKIPTVETILSDLIQKAMDISSGNQAKAASLIGVSQPTISRKLKELKK